MGGRLMGKHGIVVRHETIHRYDAIGYFARAAAELSKPFGALADHKAAALLYGAMAMMELAKSDPEEAALELATELLERYKSEDPE